MKNLLTLILLFLTIQAIGRNVNCAPVTREIDKIEASLIESYGEESLLNFYVNFEHDVNRPLVTHGFSDFRNTLKYDNITFIINGWLYVVSYEDNTDTDIIVRVHLYRKDVRTLNNEWERACGGEILTIAKIHEGRYFNPGRNRDNKLDNTIKLSDNNVVFALCGEGEVLNKKPIEYNELIIFEPHTVNDNGSITFNRETYFDMFNFPTKLIEISENGDGKYNLLTIDNYKTINDGDEIIVVKPKERTIKITVNDRNRVSFDGYGKSVNSYN